MSEGINLLAPNKKTGSSALLRRINKMRLATIGLLFFISVSSVILFILVALSPLPALQRQEQFLEQTLLASKDSIAKVKIVNSQTDAINGFLTKRGAFEKPLDLVRTKLSRDVSVNQIQMDSDSLLVTVESPSLQSLDSFLSNLVNYVHDKNTFSKVTLVDLATNQNTDTYDATIQLSY